MDATQILLAVIALIGAVVTGILVPFIKIKIDSAKATLDAMQLDKLNYWTRTLIAAAESAFTGSGQGKKKTDWVIQQLHDLGLSFDAAVVKSAIKGLCRELTAGEVINNK